MQYSKMIKIAFLRVQFAVNYVITLLCFFSVHLEISEVWQTTNIPMEALRRLRREKACQVRLNVKGLLTVLFDYNGLKHHEFLKQGRTTNKEYYIGLMRRFCETIR